MGPSVELWSLPVMLQVVTAILTLLPEIELSKVDVKIALMVPEKHSYFSRMMVEPAIEEAIVEVGKRGLLPLHRLNVTKVNTKCDAIRAPVAAFRFMDDGGHAFFGPVCDYSLAPVARYAPSWGLPVLSPGGLAEDFLDKNVEYKTLTRMGMAFDSMSRFILAAIAHYRWPKLKLLYDPNGQSAISDRFCFLAGSAIIKEIKTKRKDMKGDYKQLTTDPSTYAKILREDVGVKYSIHEQTVTEQASKHRGNLVTEQIAKHSNHLVTEQTAKHMDNLVTEQIAKHMDNLVNEQIVRHMDNLVTEQIVNPWII